MAGCLTELEQLKEDEETLMALHTIFSDQLNRLKVEELGLTNLLRLEKEEEMRVLLEGKHGKKKRGRPSNADDQALFDVLNLSVNPEDQDPVIEEEEDTEAESSDQMDGEDSKKETGGHMADQSFNSEVATYLGNLLQQQREQNQQVEKEPGQLMLSLNDIKDLELELADEENLM